MVYGEENVTLSPETKETGVIIEILRFGIASTSGNSHRPCVKSMINTMPVKPGYPAERFVRGIAGF
ncbi:hypothetical protein SF123566_6470 [Shigella flexneri 1235-66]|nr:hypothetical protein SF123566_6470 [Shigella flexneri 1235-66]